MKTRSALLLVALVAIVWGWHEHLRRVEDERQVDRLLHASHLVQYVVAPAVNDFRAIHQRPPASVTEAGLPPPGDRLWDGYDHVDFDTNGAVRFQFHDDDLPRSQPAMLVVSQPMAMSGSDSRIVCFVQGVPQRILLRAQMPCSEQPEERPAADSRIALDIAAASTIQTVKTSLLPIERVMDAVSRDDDTALSKLKQDGVDLCGVDPMQRSALGDAARDHQLKTAAWLVNYSGCTIDRREPASGRTPLQTASAVHDLDVVHLLLEHGADPRLPDATGASAWILLGPGGVTFDPAEISIRQAMMAKGVSIDDRDAHGQTLLMLAADGGRLGLVQWLLDHNAAIDAQDQTGRTALMRATMSRAGESALPLLLNRGANTTLADRDGVTAQMLARQIVEADRRQRVTWMLSHPQSALL